MRLTRRRIEKMLRYAVDDSDEPDEWKNQTQRIGETVTVTYRLSEVRRLENDDSTCDIVGVWYPVFDE